LAGVDVVPAIFIAWIAGNLESSTLVSWKDRAASIGSIVPTEDFPSWDFWATGAVAFGAITAS